MSSCVIFGGAGFIGRHLAIHFLKQGRFDHVHIADIEKSTLDGHRGITTSLTDVRRSIDRNLIDSKPDWIFNLAAIHREPGHLRQEYFETNLNGARNVCAYAERVGCDNIYFTSSISVYGPTTGPTDESKPIQPSTPYGGSKFPAELIHTMWMQAKPGRRLLISRPGVIYGPGDPGNILRMINAVKKGYFAFPGSKRIYKSYGYIYGLIDSVDFVMDRGLDFCCYNYVESPTQPLVQLVDTVKEFLDSRALVLPVPLPILLPVSKLVHATLGSRNPIHPVRVRKAATPTHIIPARLKELGFNFKYDFPGSLAHWQTVAPEDFGLPFEPKAIDQTTRLKLRRAAEVMAPPIEDAIAVSTLIEEEQIAV
ncbi:MAG: NAD(P)-dependent oxidoreductase [Candidatus Zixiibacteriota bacterium]|nr:MAG: NAD(P)-dependent oxidoreductase [candidate division Zixibacteria bacterium]